MPGARPHAWDMGHDSNGTQNAWHTIPMLGASLPVNIVKGKAGSSLVCVLLLARLLLIAGQQSFGLVQSQPTFRERQAAPFEEGLEVGLGLVAPGRGSRDGRAALAAKLCADMLMRMP